MWLQNGKVQLFPLFVLFIQHIFLNKIFIQIGRRVFVLAHVQCFLSSHFISSTQCAVTLLSLMERVGHDRSTLFNYSYLFFCVTSCRFCLSAVNFYFLVSKAFFHFPNFFLKFCVLSFIRIKSFVYTVIHHL